MAFNYLKNVARSTAYAAPQIVKNRIPSVAALVGQLTDQSQREMSTGVLQEMRGIIKEDVFGLLKKGLDSAKQELRTGKMYQTEEEESKAFGDAMGMDESLFDNSFLEGDFGGGEGDGADALKATATVASAAAAQGAAQGVMAAASRLGDLPAQRATAEAGFATARFARANVGASLAVGNMIRGAVLANTQILGEIHRFQTTVQQDFYRKQLEHNQAMAVMTSELISKIGELKEVSGVAAAASDQLMAALSGRESDFGRVFRNDGGFNAAAYIGVMNQRLKQAVGDGSAFKMIGQSVASAPLAQGFQMALESLIPKDFGKQLKQFNEFVGDLGLILNDRARMLAKNLRAKGGGKELLGRLLGAFTIGQDTASGQDLSNIVRGKAVAFDGYAHRSIVEIIPSYLADIHAELVATRRGMGFDGPKDRKAYNFESGRFVSEKAEKKRIQRDVNSRADASLEDVRRRIGDGGSRQMAKANLDAIRIMRDSNLTLRKGGTDVFGSDLDGLIDELERSGRFGEADIIRSTKGNFVDAHKKHGSRLSYQLTASMRKSAETKAAAQRENIGKEGVHRWIESGQIVRERKSADYRRQEEAYLARQRELAMNGSGQMQNRIAQGFRPGAMMEGDLYNVPVEFTAGAAIGKQPGAAAAPRVAANGKSLRKPSYKPAGGPSYASVSDAAIDLDDEDDDDFIFENGEGEDYQRAKKGSIFRDANGKVTFKSILRAPMNAVSKAMDAFESKVSDIFFGDGSQKGIFGKIAESLFGTKVTDASGKSVREGGLFGGVINTFNAKIFDPLKHAIVGDPSDPDSKAKSVVGTMKRWFGEAVEGGKRFLFGNTVVDANGETSRQGGLFGGVVNWFSGKSKQLKEFLLGKGGDGKQPGLLTGLREKFDRMVERVQKSLFGTVGEDGRRAGGAFGDQIQKGKDFLKGLWDKFQETAVKPLGVALFGTVADGKRSGGLFGNTVQKGKDFMSKLWSDTSKFIVQPMKDALFGKDKSFVDDMGNLVSKREGGILPMLSKTLKESIVEPLAEGLLGKKTGPDGTREGGALKVIWQSMKDAFAPLKETFVGPDGIWTNMKKGLSDTWKDLKVSLFGGKDGEPQKPFMERLGEKISDGIKKVGDWLQDALKPVTGWIRKGGDWLRTKVFEPFNKWLNDPKDGFMTRMRDGVATFFYGNKNEDGIREGGLFGAVKKGMDRFFYGDSEKGTKGFVERVVEPAKKFVLEEIWQPLKKNVGEMWDNTKTFFKEEVFEPLKGVLDPFVTEAKEQWRLLKEWAKGPLWDSIKGIGSQLNDSMKGVFGKSFTDMMRDNVLNPIKEALSGVRKFLDSALKAVIKFPVNVLKGASDELAMSQIRRGVYKGSEEERTRLMAKFGTKEGSAPAGQGSSIGAAQPTVKAGGGVNEKTSAEKEQKSFWQRAKEAFTGKTGPAADEAATAVSATNANAPGTKGSGSTTAEVAASQQSAPGGQKPATRAEQAAAEASKDGSSVKGSGSKYDPIRLAQATADNTHNIYQFMTKHLWGVGKNVEKIVKHMGIKDGALGGNTDEKRPSGFMGKLRKLITNPISFIKDTIAGAFDYVKGIASRLFNAAKNVVMIPARLLGKTLSAATKVITGTVKAIAPLAGVLKDALVGTLTAAVKVTATVFKEGAKAVGTVVSSIAKAIPDVANALASATVGILKAGGQLALGAAKIAGQLATTLVEIGGKMLVTATKVAKDVVTGLAKITFDAIGGAFNMITGRGKGSKMAKLTPVYVVGGYLAGTEGGAKSLGEAQGIAGGGRLIRTAIGAAAGAMTGTGPIGALLGAGLGFFSPELAGRVAEGKTPLQQAVKRSRGRMKDAFESVKSRMKSGWNSVVGAAGDLRDKAAGGFEAVKARTDKARAAIKEFQWKDRLLQAGEKTREHLGAVRSDFSRFGSWLMTLFPMLVGGIGKLVSFFTTGKFISALGSLLKGGAGMLAEGAGAAANLAGKGLKHVAGKMGGMKGVGLGAAAGIGGTLIKDWADDNMEEGGVGKTAVKTGGAMLEYGAMGATIGSIIPGVGTAVGAGVGAGVGAVVENWDAIKGGLQKAAAWLTELPDKLAGLFSDAGKFITDGIKSFGNGLKDFFLSGGLIGKMLGWTPEKTAQLADDASKAFFGMVDGIKAIPGKLLDSAKELLTGIGDKAKDTAKGAWNWITGGDKVANRAFGGPIGRNGALVGELGPELVDAHGNVISASKFQNPALVGKAQERKDSVTGILQSNAENSYYTASLLQSINAALGGAPVDKLQARNDPSFDPRVGSSAVKDAEKKGLFATLTTAFGIDPDTGGKVSQVGSAIGNAAGEVTGHIGEAAKGALSSLWTGAKQAVSSAAAGDFSGAASAIKSGASGAAASIKAGASGVASTIKGAGSDIGSVVRGDAGKNVEMLKSFMLNNGMTDPKEQAMFLAQLDHESGGFKVLSENLRYRPSQLLKVFPKYFKSEQEATAIAAGGPEAIANRVYGGRMGNKDEGDGFKYRGRGFIQLTGRDNYTRAGKDLGIDLVSNPDLASEPETAAKIALWYWNQRGIGKHARQGDIEKVTKLINGGTIGLEDRRSKFAKYMNVVGSGTALAKSDGPATPVKTAMAGGWLSKQFPTLVGEKQPEILGPDGRIHRSVDAYLSSPSADVSGLAVNTAVKEAMKRSAAGPDGKGASDAMSKIAAAAGSLGGKSDELLTQMLAVLQQIAGNTAPISQLASAEGSGNSTLNVDASRSGSNIFALGQQPKREGPGMSASMRRVVSG